MKLDKLDKFNICSSSSLSSDDLYGLTLLYQPLIGSDALGVYLAFNSLLERSNMESQELTHLDFFDIQNLDDNKFLNSRLKLEAIGLLTTFNKDSHYIYLIKPPLTPKQFISDGALGLYLYGKIGEKMFLYLVDRFKVNMIDKTSYKNITVSFDEVFSSSIPEYQINKGDSYLLGRKPNKPIAINYHDFNFDTFSMGINKNLVEFGISEGFIKTIVNTSFVYGFDEGDMQSLFAQSINKMGVFDNKILKRKAKNLYEFKHNKELPILESKLPDSPKNSQIIAMEKVTAVQLLQKFCPNGFTEEDLKTVNDIYEQIDLPRGVLNFMIFSLLNERSGELLPLSYFKKVAITWTQLGVVTSQKAFEYVAKLEKPQVDYPKKKNNNNYKNQKESAKWVDDYVKNIKEGLEEL